ncbi:penicillin-binding protein 1C [Catalinimonas sp. 4WD22]|uniref:penicillin-binding protein 1C n=1 Tax=Catalinimonas locisalis TaxID=3133978 RepID=UPI00310112A1
MSKQRLKVSGLIVLLIAALGYYWALPDPLFRPVYSTVLEGRNGQLLGAAIASDGQWRFPLSDSVSHKFKAAIIAFEDDYFESHPGFNPFSLLRATKQNIEAGRVVSGGSTLTMQVIRLSRNGQARTVWEKLKEIILASRLELAYSKEEILALYAAHAPFGGNIVGLEAAAWRYYGRQSEQLSWGETATLAVLPNSPSLVYPGKNSPELMRKRNRLLDKLYAKDVIDSMSTVLAKREPLPGRPNALPTLAPHLLTRIRQEGQEGKRVRSSISPPLQQQVSQIIAQHHQKLKGNGIYNAAAVVLDVESGEAIAYVGNTRPENGSEHSASVDIVTAQRSTGSILKPFLYAAMLHEGSLLPYALVPDVPTYIDGFAPKNFDETYDGAVAADEALARSLNIPAVHMLRDYGIEKFHFQLRRMGMTTLTQAPGYYGLSLILGGAEATLWDLSGMYASLARSMNHYFKYPEPKRYAVADYHAPTYQLSEEREEEVQRQEHGLLDAGAMWYTLEAMAKVRRPNNQSGWEYFDSSTQLAWKTGTSFGFRDAWAIGLSSRYVVGVWVGNADGEGRPGLTGLTAAAPILFDIAELLPESDWFDYPGSDMASALISKQSGYRAARHCKDTVRMDVPRAGLKSAVCNYHQMVHLDSEGQYQVHSECAVVGEMQHQSWFVLPAVQEWYYRRHHPAYRKLPPFRADCQPLNQHLALQLIYPYDNAQIYVPKELDGKRGKSIFDAAHRDPKASIYWHLDGEYLGKTQDQHQMGLSPEPGEHTITLIDEQGEKLERRFTVLGKEQRRPGVR